MSRIIGAAFCLLLLLGVAGCAMAQPWMEASAADADHRAEPQLLSTNDASSVVAYNKKAVRLSSGTELASFPMGEEPASEPGEKPEKPTPRLKIYTARFEVLVANIAASIDRLLARVDELGGYLEKREDNSVTVRVPATHFKDVTAELRTYGLVVKEFTRSQDVTKRYFALQIRIENAEKARARLLTLLERAEKVEDAIKIEQELRRLTDEIELMKGDFKLLGEQIAFSTVEVHFSTNAPPPRAVKIRTRSRFPWVNQIGVEHVLENF